MVYFFVLKLDRILKRFTSIMNCYTTTLLRVLSYKVVSSSSVSFNNEYQFIQKSKFQLTKTLHCMVCVWNNHKTSDKGRFSVVLPVFLSVLTESLIFKGNKSVSEHLSSYT